MFQIFLMHTNLDIRIEFFRYNFFGFFRLTVRIRLIVLWVQIYFVTPYKTHSDISNIQTGYESNFTVQVCIKFRVKCIMPMLRSVDEKRFKP